MKKKKYFYLSAALIFTSLFSYSHTDGFETFEKSGKYLNQLKKLPGAIDIEDGSITLTDNLTIQANKFHSEESKSDGFVLKASGNVMVSYNRYTFICDEFEYNEKNEIACLTNGKFAVFPWFIGGKSIIIKNSGIKVKKGYVSTSEGPQKNVVLSSPLISFSSNDILTIHRAVLKIKHIPVFFFPTISFNPNKIKRPPFSLRGGGGGFLGSYVGINYCPFSSKTFSKTLIFDHFFGNGVGFGSNLSYKKSDCQFIDLKNYYAHSLCIDTPNSHDRYRLKGKYLFRNDNSNALVFRGCYHVTDSWETIADISPRNFSLPNTGPTEFSLYRNTNLSHFLLRTRFKVNDFQSVEKELPYVFVNKKAGSFKNLFFFENSFDIGYRDYSFSYNIPNAKSFSCLRASLNPRFYTLLPIKMGSLSPGIEFIGIYYNKTPEGMPEQQLVGKYSLDYKWALMKKFSSGKHFVEPYVTCKGITHPQLKNNEHYIFSVRDAFNILHLFKSGFSSVFLNTQGVSLFNCDIGTLTLWNNKTTGDLFPKIYVKGTLSPTTTSKINLETEWITKKHTWDHWNISWKWAPGKNLAISSEFLHRSKYSWIKSDKSDFVLDVSRTEKELLQSPLSDARNLLLSKIFVRLHPGLSYKLFLRHGRREKDKPGYFEYQMTLVSKIFEHWCLETIYEHREADNRLFFLLQLDGGYKI
ncbi:MAG: hypothetical protein RSB82_02240 [Victivallaceae bacterium]